MFTLSGLCAGFAGLFLISKLGSARASIAKGYEMEVIAMAILGGVSTAEERARFWALFWGCFQSDSCAMALEL
ncbi:MAG: ABC transporter permease subunit [Enterocloster clostridioformis]